MVASVMTPSVPSLPIQRCLTSIPLDERGTARVSMVPAGVTMRSAIDHVFDLAVTVALHARRTGSDPAAEGREQERVGEVTEGEALGVELLLHVRAHHAGLDPRGAGFPVHLEHPVHPPQVEHHHHPALVVSSPRRSRRCWSRRRTE